MVSYGLEDELYLVSGILTPLKHMNISWDDYSQYMEKHNFIAGTHYFDSAIFKSYVKLPEGIWLGQWPCQEPIDCRYLQYIRPI